MQILPTITGPADVKKLSIAECEQLAKEVRQCIIDTVSHQGGHLASNLGIVDLTIALHRSFDSPKDQLVFDVGHQVYAHKLLTGRQGIFKTLRSYHGMSGFPCQAESEHDLFDTGHSSTSISMALGLARARDLKGEDRHVVAIVGDGALTGGECYEAMNDAGQGHTRLIVILNDNEMSISKNVGALSKYFKNLRASASWYGGKKRIKARMTKFPLVGKPLAHVIENVMNMVKSVTTGGELFEALGFRYLGPFDGKNIDEMSRVFEEAKAVEDMPVLIHIVTVKGDGYDLAERQPERFHGTAPFRVETGLKRGFKPSKSAANCAGSILVRMASEDERVLAVTAAMSTGTGLSEFARYFPKRFFDVGIAEQHAVTLCAGMARGGFRPFFAVYATFFQRAYDQMIHDVCLQNLPVCILADHAGLVGDDGKTHHGVFILPMCLSMPNLVVLQPRDSAELECAMRAVLKLDTPSVIAYPKEEIEPYASDIGGHTLEVGRWQVLREGEDAALLATGRMTKHALEAAGLLKQDGIQAAVIDCCSLKPMDTQMLSDIGRRCIPMMTIEEGQLEGGMGSEIARCCMKQELPVPKRMLGIGDRFVTHGAMPLLLEECGLMPDQIAMQVKEMLAGLTAGMDDGRQHAGKA
ncbi:MAG: 1-deoxy-D-xylulose-5-phosphate synthase [Clostridia bacterium]|nr:1-deoxy-D-xylulose-5-phosphate synthase [Clostridia bacterium]